MSSSARSLATAFALVTIVILVPSVTGAPSDGTIRVRWSSGFASRSFEARGTVEFAEDDRDVKSISPGGYIRIEEGSWLRTVRSYEVRADSRGLLSRTYIVDGRRQTMDADAQAWAAAAMLTLIRETGVSAGLRVERLLRLGPAEVLREVSKIRSDGSKRIYLRELVERGRLTDEQFRDVTRSARTIGSDGDKTGLLIEVSRSYLRLNLRASWFTALGEVGSDGDKRRGLEHAIRSDPGAETLALSARLAASIGSDSDKAAVLSAIAARGLAQEVRRPWFRAVQTIGSDGDKRQVLSTALAAPGDDSDTLIAILRTAETIGSDGDKANLLVEAARSNMGVDAVQRAFFSAANTIGSDGDRNAVLTSVLRTSNRPTSLLTGLAQSAQAIGSDGDKAAVLSLAAEFEMNNPAARASFFTAVNTIGSDGDRAAVLSNVLRKPKLAIETAVAAIDSATAMGSDGDKAAVLVIAARHASDPAVRASLESALKSVHSDGDYRRVSAALLRLTN